jgi:ArsR family transcriptional regulator
MEKTLSTTKALADGNRLRIIMVLTEQTELCICQITELLGWATATVSRHMSVLQNARLVRSRKDGRWVYYRLADEFPEALHRWIVESMEGSKEIENDRRQLQSILSYKPDELCRRQKTKRRSCHA